MNAPGQFPQLDQGFLRLLAGRLDQRHEFGIRAGRPAAGQAERQAQGDQALLGAVMQVALQSAPRQNRYSLLSSAGSRTGSG